MFSFPLFYSAMEGRAGTWCSAERHRCPCTQEDRWTPLGCAAGQSVELSVCMYVSWCVSTCVHVSACVCVLVSVHICVRVCDAMCVSVCVAVSVYCTLHSTLCVVLSYRSDLQWLPTLEGAGSQVRQQRRQRWERRTRAAIPSLVRSVSWEEKGKIGE